MLNDRLLDTRNLSGRTTKYYISVAGICCAIISQETGFLNLLWERYWRFESGGPAEYEIIVQFLPPEAFTQEDTGVSTSPLVRRMNSGSNFLIKPIAQPFLSFANTATKKILVKMVQSQHCFDNFLQTIFTLVLAEKGGLMLSASVINENRQANIFLQASNNSNSPTLQPDPDNITATGQPVIIKPHNNHFRVYGTPFQDEQIDRRTNGRTQLGALYVLKKDSRNDLITLEKARAVPELYRCASYFTDDSHLLNRVLHTCCKIIDTVPVYELRFHQDPFQSRLIKEPEQADMAFHIFMPVK